MHSFLKMLSSHSTAIILIVIFFALSVIVHEAGHFIAAKLFRLYVPKFSIGFGKKLFSVKLFGTEFCISLLPLGGYVSIPQLGDIKELDLNTKIPEGLKHASPTAKIFVAAMGPLFNIVLAFALALFLWINGMSVSEGTDSGAIGFIDEKINLNGTYIDNPISQAGIEPGDKILAVNGVEIKGFYDIHELVSLGIKTDEAGEPESVLSVLRYGETISIVLHHTPIVNESGKKIYNRLVSGIYPQKTLTVKHVVKDSASDYAAIKEGDVFMKANGKLLYNDKILTSIISNRKNKNDVYVTVKRDNTTFAYNLTPQNFTFCKPYITVNTHDLKCPIYIIPIYNRGKNTKETLNINEHVALSSRSQFELFSADAKELQKFGIANNTKFIYLNNVYIRSLNDASIILKRLKDGQEVSFVINENDKNVSRNLHFKSFKIQEALGKPVIGIEFKSNMVKIYTRPYEQISHMITITAKTIQSVFTPKSDLSVSDLTGPIGLAKMLFDVASVNFTAFIWFIILININLAMFNLIPLPILDGGHIVAGFAEYFINRDIVQVVLNKLQTTFFFLLLTLILYVTFLDMKRLIMSPKFKQRMTLNHKIQIEPEMLDFGE